MENVVVLSMSDVRAAQRRAGRDQTVSERVRDVKDAIKDALTRSR